MEFRDQGLGFPKIGGAFPAVLIIRIIVIWVYTELPYEEMS